jgi:DNA-directed RNA polymerase subunit RPC12/RpoP
MTTEVRCTNPKCGAKIAEALTGTIVVTCRKCGLRQTISR